jgi:Family of unknown function (DUF5681)
VKFQRGKSGNPGAQFVKGRSGNPRGRPKKVPELIGFGAPYVERLLSVLINIAFDEKASPASRISAVNGALDRILGRPAQTLHHSGDEDGAPVAVHSNLDGFMAELAKIRKRIEETEIED